MVIYAHSWSFLVTCVTGKKLLGNFETLYDAYPLPVRCNSIFAYLRKVGVTLKELATKNFNLSHYAFTQASCILQTLVSWNNCLQTCQIQLGRFLRLLLTETWIKIIQKLLILNFPL